MPMRDDKGAASRDNSFAPKSDDNGDAPPAGVFRPKRDDKGTMLRVRNDHPNDEDFGFCRSNSGPSPSHDARGGG